MSQTVNQNTVTDPLMTGTHSEECILNVISLLCEHHSVQSTAMRSSTDTMLQSHQGWEPNAGQKTHHVACGCVTTEGLGHPCALNFNSLLGQVIRQVHLPRRRLTKS